MKRICISALIFVPLTLSAQYFPVSPNKLDENGKRTGHWTLLFDSTFTKEVRSPDSVRYYRLIKFEAGKPVGKVRDFYRNGQKQWEGFLISLNPQVFEGLCIYYFQNGQVQFKINYSDGKANGLYQEYSANGRLIGEGQMKDDQAFGKWKYTSDDGSWQETEILSNQDQLTTQYHANGNIQAKGIKRKNKKEGLWINYYEDGTVNTKCEYKNGDRDGKWEWFNKNGVLEETGTYRKGKKFGYWIVYQDGAKALMKVGSYDTAERVTGHWIYYHLNGNKKSEGEMFEGGNLGDWKFYHEDGSLKSVGKLEGGKFMGQVKYYYPSGALEQIVDYVRDTLHGHSVDYYENGNVHAEGEMVKDKKHGLWRYFSPSGDLTTEEMLNMGDLQGKTLTYHPKGKVKDVSFYKKGKRDSLYISYFPSGNIESKGFYKDGNRQGEWNWYYDNGRLDSKYFYKDGLYEGPFTAYYDNGVLWKTGSGLHGESHGWTIRRYMDGRKKEEGLNQNGKGTGQWKAYDSATGKVTSIWGYRNGKYHGKNIYYTKDRQKKVDYYIDGFKETPYNIRDSIYVLVKKLKLYDQAWKAVEWVERVLKRDYPKNDPANSLPLYLRGYILQYGRGDAAAALPYVQKYLALQEKLEGKNSDNYINGLNDLANLYSSLNRVAESIVIYDTLLVKTRTTNFKSFNTYLYNKVMSVKDMGNKAGARKLYLDEINKQEQKGKTHPDAFAIRKNWAEYNFNWDFSDSTAQIYEELMKDAAAVDPQSDLVLHCLRQISYCHNSFNNRPVTVRWLKRVIDLMEKKQIPSFGDYAHDLDLMANQYVNMRYLDSAFMVYDKLATELDKRHLRNTYYESDMLDGIAEIHFLKWEYNKALELWQKAKGILEGAGFEKTVRYAEILQGVALCYNSTYRTKEAIEIYQQALAISKQENGEYNKNVVQDEITLSGMYIDLEDYQKAEKLLQEVLKKITDKPNFSQRGNYALAQRKLADIKRNDEDYTGAIACDEKAVAIYETDKTSNINSYAETMTDLSFDYRKTEDYEKAERLLSKAMEEVDQILGKETQTYLRVQWTLATTYREKGLYSDAEKTYTETLKGYEKVIGKNQPTYSYVLRDLATCYLNADENAKAKKTYEKYLLLAKSLGLNHSYDYMIATKNLARAEFLLDKNDEAEKHYLEMLNLAAEIYGTQHPSYAFYLRTLADFYFEIRRNAEAEERIATASQIMRESSEYGPKSPAYSRYIVLQGKILSTRDKNKEAEELLDEALRVTTPFQSTNYSDHVSALEALADFYQKMGRHRNAEKLLKEVLDLTEKRSGKAYDYATKKMNLMAFYYGAGRYTECLTLGRELIPYFEAELSMSHYMVREVRNIMGLSELYLENFKAAADHFKFCIEILDLAKATRTPQYAIYLNNFSLTTMALGDFAATEKLLMQAADIRKENNVVMSPFNYAMITDNYASLYQAWGKLDRAEKYWLDVTNTLLKNTRQNFYFLSDEEKAQFWNQIKGDFEYFNTFALLRAKQNPAILGEMYNNQLATKAILLSASNKIKKRILSSRDKEMVAHYYNWVDIRERLAQLYTSSEAELKAKKTQVDSLELVAKNLEKELNISAEDLAQDKGGQNKSITWKEVQRALSPNEAAVEIIRFRYYDRYLRDSLIYAALVLTSETKQNPKLVVLPNGKLLEGRAIRYYKNAVTARVEDKFSYNYFWQPLDAALTGKTRVYLSLDGVYNQINLNTLVDNNGKFLVESKNLTIVSNTKDLLLMKGKKLARTTSATASLFGYPKYFIGKQRIKEKIENQKRDLDFSSLDDNDATGIAELPGTQTEIAQVKNILASHHWQTSDFTDELATEKALKSIDYPRVLHIATHGFFVDENEASSTFKMGAATEYAKQNPLLRSGLLLSGASNFIQNNVRLEEENGILTAYEAANLNLDNTDLVVLSACETGKGEVQNGEGVYGLQRAFQTAGAQAIIMSLWKVDDEATQELMTSFYENWMKGIPKAEAFRQAQLQLKSKYSHPYYWGAFVMMGN